MTESTALVPSNESQLNYRKWADSRIRELVNPSLIEEASQGSEMQLREIYKKLGVAGLLAPSWPKHLGGGGLPSWAAVECYEAIADAGIPDTPHILGVQIVGRFLLRYGNPAECEDTLKALASGSLFACVLYTEPAAGSDLASVSTSAIAVEDGFLVNGTKHLNLLADIADVGLLLAKTPGPHSNRYQGLSLLLVDMRSPGVFVSSMRSLQHEPYCRVRFRNVKVPESSCVGIPGEAWGYLDEALAVERTGLDHASRARRWLSTVRAASAPFEGDCGSDSRELDELGVRVCSISRIARHAARLAETGPVNATQMALAKVVASDAARDVAWFAAQCADESALTTLNQRKLGNAINEAPGLCLSAGTSEMMFATMSAALGADAAGQLDPGDLSLEPEIFRATQAVLRDSASTTKRYHPETEASMKRSETIWSLLDQAGLSTIEQSLTSGGLGLPLRYGVAISEALGAQYLEDPYANRMLLDNKLGQSWIIRHLARTLSAAQSMAQESWKYLEKRTQFGEKLSSYPALTYPLMQHLCDLEVARNIVHHLAENYEDDPPSMREINASTAYAQRVAFKMATLVMHINGTQSMTELSTNGTGFSYIRRNIRDVKKGTS